MHRRQFLTLCGGLGLAGACAAQGGANAANAAATIEPLRLSDAEWKMRLSPAQYAVLRGNGTERARSSALNAEKRHGIYHCAGCALALFSSDAKYESGTGWPSFSAALPGAVATRTEFLLFLPRLEYHCARCAGHQGHVFGDGPAPNGDRYCNNGVALNFIAAA